MHTPDIHTDIPISPTPKNPSVHTGYYVALVVVILILTGVYFAPENFFLSKRTNTAVPTPRPTPTPIRLHEGIGDYTVSHGETNGPTIANVIFNPLDVRKGQQLTLSIKLRSATPVLSVTGTLQTDTGSIPMNFTKTLGSDLQTWTTELPITDTVWYTYVATITATNSTGTTMVTVAPRS